MTAASTPMRTLDAPALAVADIAAFVLLALAAAASIALLAACVWPWRVDASLKALGSPASLSIAAGLELAGFSASLAAIVGGPGVVALHRRGRELWRRGFTTDEVLAWLGTLGRKTEPAVPEGRLARFRKRLVDWTLARTDLADLPELGLRVLGDLRDVALEGAITCGFRSAKRMGKAATVLYPIAGVLAPLGRFDVDLDWSGKDHVDGAAELSFRFVLARIARQGLWFLRRHFHPFRRLPTISAAAPPPDAAAPTTP